jgi:MtN3 and saliva related transmembrane protein
MLWTLIGAIAATLTMFSFVPQIVKSFKTKSVKDLSEITLLQLFLGAMLWAIYGIYLKNIVIITANLVTLVTVIILLAMYIKYGRSPK